MRKTLSDAWERNENRARSNQNINWVKIKTRENWRRVRLHLSRENHRAFGRGF